MCECHVSLTFMEHSAEIALLHAQSCGVRNVTGGRRGTTSCCVETKGEGVEGGDHTVAVANGRMHTVWGSGAVALSTKLPFQLNQNRNPVNICICCMIRQVA